LNRIRVSIRDTGIGMSPIQQSQLFQAFNRLGQEGGSIEGTGIGLVVAKQLVFCITSLNPSRLMSS
jgi:signal transduction histidine kinase